MSEESIKSPHYINIINTDCDEITIVPYARPIDSGKLHWPLEKDGLTYKLSDTFKFAVPKGIDYFVINVPVIGSKPLYNCKIRNKRNNKTWLFCTSTTTTRAIVHVSHYTSTTIDSRVIYELQIDGDNLTAESEDSPTIDFYYSYDINKTYMNDVRTNIIEDLYLIE